MKEHLLEPFADSTVNVLRRTLADETISRSAFESLNGPHVSHGMAVIIGISGTLQGHIIFDLDGKTATAMASVMNEETLSESDDIVHSTISELANMIVGHATSILSANGYRCDISPPTFVIGPQARVLAHRDAPHSAVAINTRCGTVTISIALIEDNSP